jgi:hypothetical protein
MVVRWLQGLSQAEVIVSLTDDLHRLGALAHTALALLQFAESLHPNHAVELKGERWVFNPNFVTLTPHWKRVTNIAFSLRGNPDEFPQDPVLPLKAGMAGYSECTVTEPRQLAAAAAYIQRAYELYQRGRTRDRKRVVLREV